MRKVVSLLCETGIPRELAVKISPGLLFATGASGIFFEVFGIALAVLALHGTLILHYGELTHHSLFMYFLGPWVSFGVPAVIYTIQPFRPWRGGAFVQRKRDIDTGDPEVMRLVRLFKSSEARRQLWYEAVKLAVVLFLIMTLLALLFPYALTWSLSPIDLNIGMAITGGFTALASGHIRWGLAKWASLSSSADKTLSE